jgi:hypothetical protein
VQPQKARLKPQLTAWGLLETGIRIGGNGRLVVVVSATPAFDFVLSTEESQEESQKESPLLVRRLSS